MSELAQWLRYNLASGWWLVVLVFIMTAFLAIWKGEWREGWNAQPGIPVEARITGIGFSPYRWNAFQFMVTASDAQGATGYTGVGPAEIAGCSVGDKIKAERKGISLRLHPAPCQPKKITRPHRSADGPGESP